LTHILINLKAMEVIYLLSFYLLYFTKYDDPKAQQHNSFWLDNYF